MRIGQGWDTHRLTPGRRLVLGGLEIPFERGLLGHSDADVLLHSVADAILGGLALGDIGQHFPDDDPRFEGADSKNLLGHVVALMEGEGYRIGNLDVTVICQKPRLASYIPAMRQGLAGILKVDLSDISIKATTREGLGPEGRGEAITAMAVVLLTEA